MIAECQNEQTMLMWSTANEFLAITNSNDEKTRLEEFKRRFSEARHEQVPLLPLNTSRRSTKSRSSIQKLTSQQVKSPLSSHLSFLFLQILDSSLTTCEELHIIESIYRLSQCTYTEAKRIAEETYVKIICTNNRENSPSFSLEMISEQWFLTFTIRQINYLRKYSSIWLPDLEGMIENIENKTELYSLISSMKESL